MRLIIKGCGHIDDKQHRIEIDTYPEDVNFHEEYFAISGYFGKHGPHVFAAAPELLEALEVMLNGDEMGEYECQRTGFPRMIQRLEKARAAIAKAKGEQ